MTRTGRWPARIALGLSITMVATFMTLMSMNSASGQGAGIPTVGIDVQSASLTQVTYSIVVRNQGTAPSTGVTVRSNVPADTTFESSDPPPSTTTSPGTGSSCDNAGTREPETTTCQWNLGTIPAGESRTITAVYNLNQSNVASYRVTLTATATDNEGNSNSDTDDSLVRQRANVSDDTWVDDAEPPNTNHGTCNFLRVLQGNRVTSFVESDTLVTVPAATSNSTNSLEKFYGAQLRLEVFDTTYTAQSPGTVGAHRITSGEWSQGGGNCQGGTGSGDQARTGAEPASAATPTGTAQIDGAPAIANFEVTADLDTEGERGSFQGWELKDQSATGENSTRFHSIESATANDASDPRIFLVYTTAESPTCIDADPDTATAPIGGEHVMRVLVTDGAKTPAPGNTPGSSMGPGGDACNGAPTAAPVEWAIEDDTPDIYFSSQEGATIQKVVSGSDAQPNTLTTTADDGTTFVGVRLDEPPTTSDTTNRIEARIQGTTTADPDPSPSPTPAQQCAPATLPPGGNCSGETSAHDDVSVTWNTPSGSSGSTTGSASASTSASASSSPSASSSASASASSSASASASSSASGSPSSSTSTATGSPTGTASGSSSSPQQSSRTISLFATPSEVVYPGQVTLSGQISSADSQCDDAGEFVRIQRRLFGETSYSNFETDNTDAEGRFEVSFPAEQNAEYVAVAPRHDQCADATSSPVNVSVKVKITGRAGQRSVPRGNGVGIVGRVQPDHDGTTVLLQRRKGGRWVTIGRDDLNARSRYRFVLKAGWQGRRTFRAVWKAQDDDHEANTSRNIVIRTTRR